MHANPYSPTELTECKRFRCWCREGELNPQGAKHGQNGDIDASPTQRQAGGGETPTAQLHFLRLSSMGLVPRDSRNTTETYYVSANV